MSTLNGCSLKLVNKFAYLGSSVSSTDNDINMWLAKPWTATRKIKRNFFKAAVVSFLLYECTTWTLSKCIEKMLRALLNPESNIPQNRSCTATNLPSLKPSKWDKHAGHCWRSKDELISGVLLWIPSHGHASIGRPTRTYLQQLCTDTECSLEDLSGEMQETNGEREI